MRLTNPSPRLTFLASYFDKSRITRPCFCKCKSCTYAPKSWPKLPCRRWNSRGGGVAGARRALDSLDARHAYQCMGVVAIWQEGNEAKDC